MLQQGAVKDVPAGGTEYEGTLDVFQTKVNKQKKKVYLHGMHGMQIPAVQKIQGTKNYIVHFYF